MTNEVNRTSDLAAHQFDTADYVDLPPRRGLSHSSMPEGIPLADYRRVQQWIADGFPKAAGTAFTAGIARDAARLIEEAFSNRSNSTGLKGVSDLTLAKIGGSHATCDKGMVRLAMWIEGQRSRIGVWMTPGQAMRAISQLSEAACDALKEGL